MPTRPTKGDHGHADRGSKGRGGQKATQGSAVDADIAAARRELDPTLQDEEADLHEDEAEEADEP